MYAPIQPRETITMIKCGTLLYILTVGDPDILDAIVRYLWLLSS